MSTKTRTQARKAYGTSTKREATGERYGRRQPRPAPRRTGTRAAIVARAAKEA